MNFFTPKPGTDGMTTQDGLVIKFTWFQGKFSGGKVTNLPKGLSINFFAGLYEDVHMDVKGFTDTPSRYTLSCTIHEVKNQEEAVKEMTLVEFGAMVDARVMMQCKAIKARQDFIATWGEKNEFW